MFLHFVNLWHTLAQHLEQLKKLTIKGEGHFKSLVFFLIHSKK